MEACAIAVVAGSCFKGMEIEDKYMFGGEGGMNFLTGYGETTYAGAFTTTWSYTTSDDAYLAGRSSDAFLVPNLNAEYKEVEIVSWDATACNAAVTTEYQLSLEPKETKAAVSFATVYDIEKHIVSNRPPFPRQDCLDYPHHFDRLIPLDPKV